MDGVVRTQGALFESERDWLTIGGGNDAYVLALHKGDAIRVALDQPRPAHEDERVWICNGQPLEYPRSEVVSVDTAVPAPLAYLDDRGEASELLWDDET